MDGIVGTGGVGAADAITTISSCCDTIEAAPTPSSCLLTVAPSPTLLEEEAETATVTATTTATTHKIPLPWDFTATELCRSCGKPHTELYELFENEHIERTSNSGIIDESNSGNNNDDNDASIANNNDDDGDEVSSMRDPRGIARGAIATETAANQQPQLSKMDNILQEMQIWQLRIKSNDGLPQRICPKCTAQFYIIGKFRRKCLKVQIRLRAMYEEQQLLQNMEEKETLDIPPMLDIGNDLINDNYGQPLSEVELFETNWNAEATNNGSLIADEMLVDEPLISAVVVNDADNNNELTSAAKISTAANELQDTIEDAPDCPELVLDSTPSLGTTIDIAVKDNIDEESLLDSHAMFKTSHEVQPTKHSLTAEELENVATPEMIDTDEIVPDSTDYYAHHDPLDEASMSNNNVEMISIENLDSIELLTTPSTSKQAALRNLKTSASKLSTMQQHELVCKNINQPNSDNKKDCITQKDFNLLNITNSETSEVLQTYDSIDVMKNKNEKETTAPHIESQHTHVALVTHPYSLNATRADDNVTPTSLIKLNEEGMRFVSKAALKEYSSPLPFTAADNGSCNMEPELEQTTPDILNDNFQNSHQPIKDNPPETLIFPYAQKRRKKCRLTAKPASLKRIAAAAAAAVKDEMESINDDFLFTRECSVRLCRLSDSQLSKLTMPSSYTSDNSDYIKIENVNIDDNDHYHTDDAYVQNMQQHKNPTTKEQQTEKTDENVPKRKRLKLSLKSESFILKRRGSQWKTKAEMKALNMDPLGFRKPSLRRQLKLEKYALKSSYTETQAAEEKEIQSENLKADISVESLEQPTTTSTAPEYKTEKHKITSHQVRVRGIKSKHQEKLKLKNNLRANLIKLQQHNKAVATNIERQMVDVVSPIVGNITHDFTAMPTETAPVAEFDKVLTTTFVLPADESLRDADSINKPFELEGTRIQTTADIAGSSKMPLEKMLPYKIDELLKHEITTTASSSYRIENTGRPGDYNTSETSFTVIAEAAENFQAPAAASSSSSSFDAYDKFTIPIRTPKSNEPDELIIRVPLAVLTEEFQRMHFSSNVPLQHEEFQHNTDDDTDTAEVSKMLIKPTATMTSSWLESENAQRHQRQTILETATNFCERAAADACSETAGARSMHHLHHHHHTQRATTTNTTDDDVVFMDVNKDKTTACSQNESDQSDFYGFSNESDPAPAPTASYDINEPFIVEKHSTLISSQINDFINDFQTHCLDAEEKSPANYSHDSSEKNSSSLQSLQTRRDDCAHLANNGLDNYVENTINGLLNEIQDQNLFSPSTTPLVTMESEDFHHHSSYSPLSDASDQTHSAHHHDYIKNNLCDLSPGPTVNPSHIIEVNPQHVYANSQQQQQQHHHHYNNYVECFTEDSTQSELIGFQNDIPCFENIELSSSTPRRNSTPPPVATAVQQQIPTTPTRATNNAPQGSMPNHGKNLELTCKQAEVGNVQYLGLTNDENNLCRSLNTDVPMGLVCTTSNGVQMHTPTLTGAAGQTHEVPFEHASPSSECSDNSREYAVDSATLHLTQIFHDLPLQQDHDAVASTSQKCTKEANALKSSSSPSVATSKKSTILAKYAAGNTAKRLIYPKKNETTPKLQYVTLAPQNTAMSLNTEQTAAINSQLLAAAANQQEMLNLGNTKYTLYTEVLPQDLQWQSTASTPDQQTTTTYYINAAELNQSNLISTTTISMSPLITSGGGGGSVVAGADLERMSNITLIPTTQLSQPSNSAAIIQAHNSDLDKRSMDANENYIEGMQNQPIMIVFPQEYLNDSTSTVSALYNTATGNQVTLAPLQSTLSAVAPPPPTHINNTTTAGTTTIHPHTAPIVLNSSPVPIAAPAATAAPLPSAQTSTLKQEKVNLACRFCHKRPKFTNNLDYSNHIIETHPGENPFNCPHCPLFFTRRAQRLQHIVEAHGANRFNCAQCGQSFCAQRTLDIHLQRFHVPTDPGAHQQKPVVQQQPKLDVTPSCSQPADVQQPASFVPAATTTWQERLSGDAQQVHLEDVHLQVVPEAEDCEDSSNADNSQLATESSTLQKPPHRILGCPDCDDSFDDLANQEPHTHQLSQHSHQQLLAHGPNTSTMPSPEQTEPDSTSTTTLRHFRKQRLSSNSPNEQPERVLRSSHNCVFCEERFSSEVTLRKHHQTAHSNQTTLPFVCTMCKRGFRMRTALQRHMETHDSVGRPYECSICLVRFPRPSQLTLHKLTVHFLRKPHACNACGKQFGTESALKTHEKFHGEQNVSCDECHKKFFLLKDLKKHRRIHTGEHFYKCDICPSTFVHYKRLCAHIKTHIPLGMYIEEDPTSLQRDREQKDREQLQLTESVKSNDATDDDDLDVQPPQNSL